MTTPGLTEEETNRLKYAKKWLTHALRTSNGELYDTEEYWNYVQMKLDYQEEIWALLLKIENAMCPKDDGNFHRNYSIAIDVLARRRESVQRKQDRQRTRNAVRALSKTGDFPMLRVAYAELLTKLRTRMFRYDERKFLVNLKKAYGTTKDKRTRYYWDVFSGASFNYSDFKAVHIFPLSYGQSAMTYIFGPDANGEINSARNGLLLHSDCSSKFDTHDFSTVPQDANSSDPCEWKTIVIGGPSIYREYYHDKKLIFPTEARPRPRYLYFHYVITLILHYQKQKDAGVAELPDPNVPRLSTVWGTGGGYLRRNVVLGLIETLGEVLPDEVKKDLLDQCFTPSETNRDTEIAEMARSAEEMDLGSDHEYIENAIEPEYYSDDSEDTFIYTDYESRSESEDEDEDQEREYDCSW